MATEARSRHARESQQRAAHIKQARQRAAEQTRATARRAQNDYQFQLLARGRSGRSCGR